MHGFFDTDPRWEWGVDWAVNETSPTNYVVKLGRLRFYFWFGD